MASRPGRGRNLRHGRKDLRSNAPDKGDVERVGQTTPWMTVEDHTFAERLVERGPEAVPQSLHSLHRIQVGGQAGSNAERRREHRAFGARTSAAFMPCAMDERFQMQAVTDEERTDTLANCSQHLQQLRRAGLVTSRRDGKAVIYRLSDAKTLELMNLLHIVAERNLAQVERILRGLSDGEDAPEPVSRADLAARLADGSVTVLDVRPADEYAAGHIPGALNVSLGDLEKFLSNLDAGTEIVAYCRGPYCVYAHQAVAALRKHGLNARRLEGGLPEWREEGREVRRYMDPSPRIQ